MRTMLLWTVLSAADMPCAVPVSTAMAAAMKSGTETWMLPTSNGVPSGWENARTPPKTLLQRASKTLEDCPS